MSERGLRALVLSAALLTALFSAQRASAFCQATTCDPTMLSEMCQFNAQNCLTVGQPLAWQSNCVTVSVQAAGAPKQNIDYDAAAGSVTRAFAAWTNAACAGGAPSITVHVTGPISCEASEYNSAGGNANIVVFREDTWPYVGGEDALGLTRVRFEPATGAIWDSDIEVNAVDASLSIGDPVPPNSVDLDSLLTHEAGHLLGMAHTLDKTATMFAGYQEGTNTLRTLAPDDVTGICAIYPPTRQASSTSCEPRHGYSDLCGAQQAMQMTETDASSSSVATSKGCGISTRSNSAPWFPWLMTLAGLALLRLRRRAAKRRAF
jgi:MYXO-CTERM domain-containing protein